MSATTKARLQAATVAVAAAVLLTGFVYHPLISPPTDEAAIGAAAAADTTRWKLAHLAIAVGYGLMALAFLAIRSYLHERGEQRWSPLALPPIVLGSLLFAVLTGMEITLAAAAETGGDVEAVQSALVPWFVPILLTGAVSYTLGVLGFALGLARSAVLGPGSTRLVVGGLVVMAIARFVPLSAAPGVMAAAGVVALWPLAFTMWRHPAPQPAGQPRPLPAT
jgi:hypothetical protein